MKPPPAGQKNALETGSERARRPPYAGLGATTTDLGLDSFVLRQIGTRGRARTSAPTTLGGRSWSPVRPRSDVVELITEAELESRH